MHTLHGNSDLRSPEADQRPFKVYKPCNASFPIPNLPDDHYNPTTTDIRNAQSVLAARTQGLINAPLQTRAMRESSVRAKQERWPSTTIRIRFPDRTQLEAEFSSTDKIKSVYAFVRGCLKEEVKPIKFILYQSPPKRDLKVSDPRVRDLSLGALNLAPSSILLLRFESEEFNSASYSAPLTPAILAQAVDVPSPPVYQMPASGHHDTEPRLRHSRESGTLKWFKLGSKKST